MAWSELRNQERKLEMSNSSGPIVNGKMKEFAGGGTTPAFEPFRVHDGEVMFSDKQHYVATAAQTRAMESSGSSGPTRLQVMGGAGDDVTRFIIHLVQNYVRVNGGNGAALGIGRVG
jgi:hypothetical protein